VLVIDTVVCLTLAKWETVSGRFGGYLIAATHALSGQQEQVIDFHSETEAKEWLASKGCKAWLKTRGYANWTTTFATPPTRQPPT